MNFLKNLTSALLDEQEKFTDLTQVAVVDENACLDVLNKRFEHKSIYTHCGPLLVAVNPYAEVDGLYSDEQLEKHLTIMPSETPEPHVFGMAARAYQKMMATGSHQAVVISGESGAGKTETAKFLLTYLAAAASGTSAQTSDSRGALQQAVMATNPIMESYGCAKTVRNDNSSRFGKLVLLKFTKTGRLEAASMQTYLLEKSRVAFQASNECNFHAFFELTTGVPPDQRAACGLPPKATPSFSYLATAAGKQRDAGRDTANFNRTREAMSLVGLAEAEQLGVFRLLVGLLHLGNVTFGDGDEAKLDPSGSAPAAKALVEAAKLLGTDPAHLGTGMVSRRLKAGSDWVTTGNTVSQASEVRHALVKQIYSYLFLWLVERINASLARTPAELEAGSYAMGGAGPHIAYVDIFGFEVFATNSLEQLCINFANEKLQRLFVGVLFESVHAMYEAEGLDVEQVEYSDNKRVVDLIGAAPQGLLSMLTEECVFPKGSDSSYLQKINTAFGKSGHEAFLELKTSDCEFGVKHFAGEVTYDVANFLEKNKDPISQDLQVLIEFSDDPFVAGLVKTAKEAVAAAAAAAASAPAEQQQASARRGKGASMRSGKFVGVVDGFKASLRSLIATLQEGELHFIRCLKPNDDKAPFAWNRDVSHRQLLSAGIVQAVAATREGYADHLPPVHVTQAFGPLVDGLDMGSLDVQSMEAAAEVLKGCGVEESMYAIGKTKVFLRPGVLDELQRLRMEHIGQYATVMQSMIRGALARIMLRRLREAAARKAEEKRRREEEVRRQREEAERRRLEQLRLAEEEARKREAEEAERRKTVQKARALSFDRKRRKKAEEEDRKKREEEEAAAARKASNDAKRAEAAERMRQQMEEARAAAPMAPGGGPMPGGGGMGHLDVSDEAGGGPDAMSVEALVARAEAEAAGVSALPDLTLPDTPSPIAPAPGGGFMLKLPESPALGTKFGAANPNGLAPAATPGKLYEQRRLDEAAAAFTCPLEDVVAYAEMIGMDPQEDLELLWIADEALQAPEPVGWEQRMDPRGNTYYCNTLTNMTMMQHPVDYHYQQLYLQFKMEKQKHTQAAQMTPRSRANFEKEQQQQSVGKRGGISKLDLRSVNGDRNDDNEPPQTPKGWIKRTSSLLTPRRSSVDVTASTATEYTCEEVEVRVVRGGERLGMELNAYNQILSFQQGGPTDRHPNIKVHDRIVAVDGHLLDNRMLTDVLVPSEAHLFVLERWVPPPGLASSKQLSPRTLLALGKARAHGQDEREAVSTAVKEHTARAKRKGKKHGGGDGEAAPVSSRFTVTLTRSDGGGLGIVCDEDNVVVDMVPGSPADLQRHSETRGDPRLQIGDKIMTADGVPITREEPLSAVLVPAASHCLSVERTLDTPPLAKKESSGSSSPMSPRGLLKAMTPRSSKRDSKATSAASNEGGAAKAQPTRALREVRLFKASEDERLGIRFVREDEGFDCDAWGRADAVTPIVAALDPKGEAARAGMEIDDMVLSINGQTGLSNTEAAAMLRDCAGTIVVVVRKTTWLGTMGMSAQSSREEYATTEPEAPMTPRSAMRRLI